MKTLLVLFGLLLIALFTEGCTDSPTATRVLEEQGYTNIELTGYDYFGCADDDDFATGFRATNPAGRRVGGVVCSSFFTKAATVRFH